MEKRLVSYRPLQGQKVSVCCLKKVEDEKLVRPGMGTNCPRCGTFMKCCWLDPNQARSYKALEVYQQKTNIEDFIPLSAIVLMRLGENSKDMSKKFVTLFDNIEESCLQKCEVIDSQKGREYLFNTDIVVDETRILRLGEDVFLILGKVSQEERDKKDEILEVVFTRTSQASLV